MKFTQAAALPLLFSAALAAPSNTLQGRSTTTCSTFDSITSGAYTIYQNLWGEAEATSGSQCLTLTSVSGGSVKWSTSWTWAGGSYNVKSYDNVALGLSTGVKLSTISSIPTTWDWSISGNSIVADVSYDMFTAASASGNNEFEIMVWLAAIGGAGPLSTSGSPIATPSISSHTFKLYKGTNGDTTVYSFVAESEIQNFTGDLKPFFTYLINDEGFSSSQYLKSIGAGTEPFTGSNVVLTTSKYSVSIE
jgi:xyloglucan-specific endo-beta-1,4-glucanase